MGDKMNNLKFMALIPFGLFMAACSTDSGVKYDAAKVSEKSDVVIKQYSSQLQAALGAALKAGGPSGAVEVCQKSAPAIAADVSQTNGATIKRISLKARNPSAVPNEVEKKYLTEWVAAPLNENKTPKDAIFTGKEDGKNYVYYMRAITLKDKPCTTCHGTNVDPALSAKIKGLYPHDEAMGYKEGDLRGAYLVKILAADVK